MENLERFIVVSPLTFTAVKFMLTTGEWAIWGGFFIWVTCILTRVLQDGVNKDTYLLFPSVGYFLVSSLL